MKKKYTGMFFDGKHNDEDVITLKNGLRYEEDW